MPDFYLGTHRANWLPLTDVPLFISAVQLRRRATYPKARGRWALDSGGFTELQQHGFWTVVAKIYAAEASRWADAVGNLDFAAIQDWMCEPHMLTMTGKTIADHQALTIQSYFDLMAIAPWVRWMPVIQGWQLEDYLSHVEQYAAAGVDLRTFDRVGVGSVCRRQGTLEAARIIAELAAYGIRIHAFGVKVDGLKLYGDIIASSDSMAWSYIARRRKILMPGCTGHINCANCIHWALEWHRTRIACALPDTRVTG